MSTTVSNIFANSLTSFRFLFFSKTNKPHNLDNNRPHIVDRSFRGRTKVAFSKKRSVHCNWPIVFRFSRHSCVAHATAICTSWKVSEVIQRLRRNSWEFTKTTTATVTVTLLNKRFNEQNNGCARAF